LLRLAVVLRWTAAMSRALSRAMVLRRGGACGGDAAPNCGESVQG